MIASVRTKTHILRCWQTKLSFITKIRGMKKRKINTTGETQRHRMQFPHFEPKPGSHYSNGAVSGVECSLCRSA